MERLPPLILAVAPRRDAPYALVAVREAGGTVRGREGEWPREIPEGALLLTWPATFPWSAAALACRERVERRGGAWVPLNTVLERVGMRPARTVPHLLDRLLPDRAEPESGAAFAADLLRAVAALLVVDEGPSRDGADRVREGSPAPSPGLREDLDALPEGPGVYEFQAADGRTLYVGKAKSLRRRARAHFAPDGPEPGKSARLAARAARVIALETGSELEALLVEHRAIARLAPALNTQESVRRRGRGALRGARLLLVLPASLPNRAAVCLVAGDGRFDWRRVGPGRGVPRPTWTAVRAFAAGESGGGSPYEEPPLDAAAQAELAEIALSWLAREPRGASRIDLATETAGEPLRARLRRLLGEADAPERIETR